MVIPLEWISIIGSAIGAFFIEVNKRAHSASFREDFSKFKSALEGHFNQDIRPKIIRLAKDKKLTLEKFQAHFSDHLERISVTNDLFKNYFKIKDKLKWIFTIFILSILLALIDLIIGLEKLSGIDLSLIPFVIFIVGIIWFLFVYFSLAKLEKYLTRFTLGEPIGKILEEKFREGWNPEAEESI